MNIIIPMAGMGKRMRPHTLTTPKPLLPIAGKPIVQRLVEDIASVCDETIENIAFIIGPTFGKEVEADLHAIAASLGAKGHICFQDEALGTAHAVYCAKEILTGNVIVGFADTLFRANFTIDPEKDGVIWVKQVEDPSAFGVVKLTEDNVISDFIEKPETFVSDLAIIGIYYFKDGDRLKREIEHLLDNNIRDKGEFQLTNALENMKNDGLQFVPGEVIDWMDCGNKNATVDTNKRVLMHAGDEKMLSDTYKTVNATIIEPCFIGENVQIEHSTIGPYVSIGDNTKVTNSVITNSIIQSNSNIKNAAFENSMVGNFVEYDGKSNQLSISDYSTVKNN
ncbi:MAG: glucose-1-phosphate thymidylyltransferase [Bacteroidia bacterium]|jgi:glucose-1-phosphate thymidylyltransferase